MSKERCIHAYRKPGKRAVFCKAIDSTDMDYCINMVMCHDSGRWEASHCNNCIHRSKPALKKDSK